MTLEVPHPPFGKEFKVLENDPCHQKWSDISIIKYLWLGVEIKNCNNIYRISVFFFTK